MSSSTSTWRSRSAGGGWSGGRSSPASGPWPQQLAVAVNTVDAAYQMLVAEGYLEARPKSGFYVLDYAGGPARPAAPVPEEDPGEDGEGEGPGLRPGHRGGGHGPVPLPHLGPHSEGAALRPGRSSSPTATARGTRTCAGPWRTTWGPTGGWSAPRDRSWWGPGWSTCWGWWPSSSGAARRPLRTPATPGAGPSWRTAGSPAGAWTSTRGDCRRPGWRRAGPTCATSPPATTFPPPSPCPRGGGPSSWPGPHGPGAVHPGGRLRCGVPL